MDMSTRRATTVAARYLGLDCHLILRTSKALVDKDPGLVGESLAGAPSRLTLPPCSGQLSASCIALQEPLVVTLSYLWHGALLGIAA